MNKDILAFSYFVNAACRGQLLYIQVSGKKQPPKTPVDGVRMKCTHAKCPFAESSYVHKECYEKLEEHLTDVLHKTGGKTQSSKVFTRRYFRPWSRLVSQGVPH